MIVIAVVDDNNGMMFNKRRQSKDRVLWDCILSLAEEGKLWMNEYSHQQFAAHTVNACDEKICVDDRFLDKAGPGEYCFVEDRPLALYEKRIEKIILFKWNRKYPSDLWFDIDLGDSWWKLVQTREFAGYSHEKITEEVYIRE